jgi:ATP-binding cassette subfamily F protein 3
MGYDPLFFDFSTNGSDFAKIMTLVSFNQVSKYFSGSLILKEISWQINKGEKIGLIGTNGVGKTTLFKLIIKELDLDSGEIFVSSKAKIGFLRQEYQLEDELTLFDEMLKPFFSLLKVHQQLQDFAEKLSQTHDEKILQKYGELQEEYEKAGGYTYEDKIKNVLSGLGFKEIDFQKKVNLLSGGEKNRAALAQVLLVEPNLLLLDEPTNHLDIAGTKWLEDYLKDYSGAVVVVSHDRYFLDQVVKEIVELENHQLGKYAGNYSFYQIEKEKRKEIALKEWESQQEFIERTQDFIARNIAGQKTRQAQSRRKMLKKLEKMERPQTKEKKIKLSFSSGPRSSRTIFETKEVSKKFGERILFEKVSLAMERGEKVGLIGPNGCGKTTFLKIILGDENPEGGEFFLGEKVQIAYFDQKLSGLSLENSVMDELWQIRPKMLASELRGYLAKFLFTGEDILRPVKSFSGGEQSRLALAKLMLSDHNFLILDEPTNHLDIASRIALENALAEYQGAILVVSHDRFFLNKVVNKLFAFENHFIREYLGNYSYYEEKKKEELEYLEKSVKTKKEKKKEKIRPAPRGKKNKSIELEKEIALSENELEQIEKELEKEEVVANWQRLTELSQKKEKLEKKLEKLYQDWEESLKEK